MPELDKEAVKSRPRRVPRQGRLSRQQRNEDRLELTPAAARFLNVLALLVFAGAIGFALTSDVFTVDRVVIIGARRAPADGIASVAGLQGRNIFGVNTAEVRAAIRASSPLIKDAVLDFRLPGEIVIRVNERTAALAWRVGDATLDVSADGVVLGPCDQSGAAVVVADGDQRALSVGDRVSPVALEGVSRLREEVPKALNAGIKEFTFSEAEGIGLITLDGVKVLFGSIDDLDSKMATLQSILEASRSSKQQLQLVDVRFRNRPYFR